VNLCGTFAYPCKDGHPGDLLVLEPGDAFAGVKSVGRTWFGVCLKCQRSTWSYGTPDEACHAFRAGEMPLWFSSREIV